MSRTQIDSSLVPAAQNVLNLLYNGGFEIHQNTNSNANNNYVNNDYFFDGWKFNKNSTRQMNGGYETGASNIYEGIGSLKADSLSGNSASDYIFQPVEQFAQLANKTITLSIAVKTNAANAVRAIISFGGPGSTTYTGSFHTGGNTFEILTVTGTIGTAPTSVNIGIEIAAQSTTYLDAAMAVIGSSAVTFIPTDPTIDLMKCQHYYEKSYALDVAPGTSDTQQSERIVAAQTNTTTMVSHLIKFKVTKRTTPTIILYRDNQASVTGIWRWDTTAGGTNARTTTVNVIRIHGFNVTQSDAVEYFAYGHWIADARM